MESQRETETCHNCNQNLDIPPRSRTLFHTCTKMDTVRGKDRSGKPYKYKVPALGHAGPHILIREAADALLEALSA